jgi:hypothetical protein
MDSESTSGRKSSSTVLLGLGQRAHARMLRRGFSWDARIGSGLTPNGLMVELDGRLRAA